jgi:hypothetical protein
MNPTEKTDKNIKSEKQTNKVGDSKQLLLYSDTVSGKHLTVCLLALNITYYGEYRVGEEGYVTKEAGSGSRSRAGVYISGKVWCSVEWCGVL